MDAEAHEVLDAELRARRDHGPASLDKAVWHLLCGEPDQGLEAIRRHLAVVPETRESWHRRAELAVVASDWELASTEARLFLRDFADRYVPGYREYSRAVLALIAGDEGEAAAQVNQLVGYVATHQRFRSGEPAKVVGIPAGLLSLDTARVAAGIEALLDWHLHRARARSEVFNSSRGVVCLDAVVALLLAHRRGLSVPVAATYRAARLPLLAIHLHEWQGEPLARNLPLELQADLVAGPWLRVQGIAITDPPPPRQLARRRTERRLGSSEVDEAIVREYLHRREQAAEGSAWQLASWALMLGDPDRGRGHLRSAAERARQSWQATAPQPSMVMRWLRQSQALPNHNYVRSHFALALALGEEDALRETSRLLQAWMAAVSNEDARRGSQPAPPSLARYAHASGYLDLLCDLLDLATHRPMEDEAEHVGGLLPSIRVACIALVERDRVVFEHGLNGMLAEHAQTLERRTSPPPPVCESAVHLAVAAHRLGLAFTANERYRCYPVPIVVRDEPGGSGRGRLGRLPCDLLGTELWASRAPA